MQELAQQKARAAEARQRASREGSQEAGAGEEAAAVHTASRAPETRPKLKLWLQPHPRGPRFQLRL